jgi:CheY-like chemotaxis protein
MKQSGGQISVYSEVGTGTTFRLYFPCTHEEEEQADLLPTGALAGKGEVILAVEDNPALQRLVVRQLQQIGYQVLEAGDGSEALELLNVQKVDLMLTDIVMPGGADGFELANIAATRWPEMKVILTSGFPRSRFHEALGARSLPLLVKPYRKEALARMVRAVLDGTDLNNEASEQ